MPFLLLIVVFWTPLSRFVENAKKAKFFARIGHLRNDRSTEVLRGFCTRATFLQGVPVCCGIVLFVHLSQLFAKSSGHFVVICL